MDGPRILGRVRITGEYVQFVPEAGLLSVPAGDEVELGVRFDYVEASHEREQCDLAFELHHPEEGAKTITVRVDDRPLIRDEELGVLVHKARFSRPGDVRLRFSLRVGTSRTPWLGGPSESGRSDHQGEVLVRVV